MTETFLVIHVLAASAWIGGGLLNGFLGPKMAMAGGETALNWMRTALQIAAKYFVTAGTLTLLSGIGLVLVDDAYDWSAPFVGIGIAAVVIVLGGVMTVMIPSIRNALSAAEAGDFANVRPNARRAALAGRVFVILLILTEISMVLRLGA